MKTNLLISLTVCLASIALAEDFKTIDRKEYKNAKVSRVEPDGIVIMFSGGIVKLPFVELPPEVQKKYGYDSQAAKDFQQQQYQGDVVRAQQLAEAKEKRQKDLEEQARSQPQSTPQAPQERQSRAASMHGSALDQRSTGPTMLIYGKVMQVIDEGLLISVRETNTAGTERIPNHATVLVVGKFPGFYDDDKIQAVGRVASAYEYQTVNGSNRTARALVGASVTKLVEFPSNVMGW
jgi:hypothetical protein